MIALGEHAEFIIAAYVGVFGCTGCLVAWTVYAARRTSQRLRELGETARTDSAA
jgi:heme exporter protein CcmD